MRFIVREVHFNKIILGTAFENLDKALMIEVIRRKQFQQVSFLRLFWINIHKQ